MASQRHKQRRLSRAASQDIPQTPWPVDGGGCGGDTPTSSCAALKLISIFEPGAIDGCAPLDTNKLIPLKHLPTAPETVWCADGPSYGYINTIVVYQITNYDSRTPYLCSVTSGSVSREEDQVSVTLPPAQQTVSLHINDKVYVISAFNPTIDQPNILTPVNGAVNVVEPISVTASEFSTTGGPDTHQSSTWQVSTSSTFTNITYQLLNSTTDLTTTTLPDLEPSTLYYVRMKQRGVLYGESEWSTVSSFTTKELDIPTANTATLIGSDSVAGDDFGYVTSISRDGNTVVVGAFAKGASTGAAYVFTRTNSVWAQRAKLVASDAKTGDSFGCAVSISGDGNYIAIGAYGRKSSKGAVYIYSRSGNTWTQRAIIIPTDQAGTDMFGMSCTLNNDGTGLLASSFYKDSGRGAIYIFTRAGVVWTQTNKLTASDRAANDYYGFALDWSNDGSVIACGAYRDDDVGANSGSVYIHLKTGVGWTQVQKLVASDGAAGDNFGYSVTMDGTGTYIAVGARGKTSKTGRVYVYARSGNTWSQIANISPSDLARGDFFGIAVSMSQDGYVLTASAYQSDGTYSNSGSVYLFTRVGASWVQSSKYTASDPSKDAWFGSDVQISEAPYVMAVGAYHRNALKGGLYIFS